MRTKAICVMLTVFLLVGCGIDPAERNNTGNRLLASSDYDEAVLAYQAAQVAEPDNETIYFNSAQALANADRLNEAEAALQLVINGDDPELIADAWYNLGNMYYEVENFDSAKAAYQEALRTDPTHNDARYNLEVVTSFSLEASPTAIEMQVEIEEQNVNEEVPPTPNPSGEQLPTPTPSPPPNAPPPGPSPENIGEDPEGDNSDEQSTPSPRQEGEMDVESAAEILEPVEAAQDRIGTFREDYNETGEQTSENDW
ncbi:MAG: tetratricopeptide repeat protein [Chloroflexota bacterium]